MKAWEAKDKHKPGGLVKLESIMKRPLKIIPLLITLLLALSTHLFAAQFKVTRVYDGDTIMAEGHDIVIYVLLAGIDAPEIGSRKQPRHHPMDKRQRDI